MLKDRISGELIRVSGTVQGVGFRPTVWRLAQQAGLLGQVWNDSQGVGIEIWGEPPQREAFVQRLLAEQPPLAHIESLQRNPLSKPLNLPDDFTIQASLAGDIHTGVAADAASCPVCLAEVLDPQNRRYRYPFTNCTHCGPRLSIVRGIPYDRCNTSMAVFPMCPTCQSEYQNPADRRFHAQPNACPVCGPQVWLEDHAGQPWSAEISQGDADRGDAIEQAAAAIMAGQIVAIKGIGGIHLACDAQNETVVQRLRQRKHRYQKAFALMARDLHMIRRYAQINPQEQALLQSTAAPIVILEAQGQALADGIAPGQDALGFMLPYTPLHHLLMQHLSAPIVLTSGNHNNEPQTTTNQDAQQRLKTIADVYLLHDREIVNRLDDSVVRVIAQQTRVLRRARGYAPKPLRLPESLSGERQVLALGAELKNTFCLLDQDKAIVSQHMGDLEDALTFDDYQNNLALYQQLYQFKPQLIAVDAHPHYSSTRLGKRLADTLDVPCLTVQHHHAHIAACMVEHGISADARQVLGIALDGLGYGDDGTLWGGEFLLVNYHGYQRLAHFQPIGMPGGTQAILEPWRNAYAHLSTTLGWQQVLQQFGQLPAIAALTDKPLSVIQRMLTQNVNSPLASSAGRLFDAVAAMLGICSDRISYEGQAAIQLESLARPYFEPSSTDCYPTDWQDGQIHWAPMWQALLSDLASLADPGVVAARFHQTLVQTIAQTAQKLCQQQGLERVVLSGGVLQNRLLLEALDQKLSDAGLEVFAPQQFPANDGGISLGQAVIAQIQYPGSTHTSIS